MLLRAAFSWRPSAGEQRKDSVCLERDATPPNEHCNVCTYLTFSDSAAETELCTSPPMKRCGSGLEHSRCLTMLMLEMHRRRIRQCQLLKQTGLTDGWYQA
jgi:hypothetical protein